MKMILSGYNGAMGKMIREMVSIHSTFTLHAGIDKSAGADSVCEIYSDPHLIPDRGDVIVDFSHPSLLPGLVDYALASKTAIVICTTGLDEDHLNTLKKASETIPVFHSGNMSLGVDILQDIMRTYAKILSPAYDIEIIEKHHNRKVDAPSGTALMLASAIRESIDSDMTFKLGRAGKDAKRQPQEIGIHAVRGGTIVGEHSILFAGDDELIEFKHTALSRKVFASGALRAAEFIVQMPAGLYNMSDVIQYFK